MSFIQSPPDLSNQYISDPIMDIYLQSILPDEIYFDIKSDLEKMGQLTIGKILEMGNMAQEQEPELHQFDAWGKRVDEVKVSHGWDELKNISAEEGLISIGYSRKFDEFSRIYQMMKLLLFTPSSAIFTCPLAMTDGAAKLIERLVPDQLKEVFAHLTSSDPQSFWTAGQWMTEKEGGSDISNSSTVAVKSEEGGTDEYRLWGDKWFTSAITGNLAMTLARIEDEEGETVKGSRGLSLFYLKIRDEDGNLNNIQINKLKDKLGTRALPTAEITLKGSEAIQLGEIGRGVKHISTILNITRIYNAVSSVAYMQRGLALLRDYSNRREAFGKKIANLPLHNDLLIRLESDYIRSFLFVTYVVELLGKEETGRTTDKEKTILRIMTPLVKLYTGKKSVMFLSEIVEGFGGMGYIEETGIPALFRDAQVFPIWEGTTNVLSLDVLRSNTKDNSLSVLISHLEQFMESNASRTEDHFDLFETVLKTIRLYSSELEGKDIAIQQLTARKLAMTLSEIIILYRLIDFNQKLEQSADQSKIGNKIKIILNRLKFSDIVDLIPLNQGYDSVNSQFFS